MKDVYQKYGPFFVIGFLIYLAFVMFGPYIMPVVTALVIAYLFYPLYDLLNKLIKKEWISSFLMCILILLIIVIPSYFIVDNLLRELPSVYAWISGQVGPGDELIGLYQTFLNDIGIKLEISRLINNFTTSVIGSLQDVLTSVPSRILNVLLTFSFLFFFLKDGKKMIKGSISYLPFGRKNNRTLLKEVRKMMGAVIYGQVATAIVQSMLATIAYYVIGLKAPLFFGLITFLLSLIPMIGPAFVYVPVSISVVTISLINGEGSGVFRGIGLLLFGLGVISTVDNIIKPLLISDRVKVHPALMILGIIGGITTFGVFGVILGPMVLVVLTTLFKIYKIRE